MTLKYCLHVNASVIIILVVEKVLRSFTQVHFSEEILAHPTDADVMESITSAWSYDTIH